MPTVSVIIAAWNAEAVLTRSVESALAQTGVEVEAIIADDCATDGTPEVARALAARDPRVRHVRLPENRGPAGARNAALDAATGDWLAVLDADDAMAPDRLAKLVAFADAEGADAVLGNFRRVDAAGAELPPHRLLTDPDHAAPIRWDLETYVRDNLFDRTGAGSGYLKPLLRRSFLAAHELRYDATLRNSEDFHLILHILDAGGAVWFHPEPSYAYTVAPGSISHRVRPEHLEALATADEAFLAARSGALSPALEALFAERLRNMRDMRSAEIVMQGLKRRTPGAAISEVLRRPRALGRISAQMGEAISKRMRR